MLTLVLFAAVLTLVLSSDPLHGRPDPNALQEVPETSWFTAYVRDDFARAPLLEVYAIFNAHRDEPAKLAGLLLKDSPDWYGEGSDHSFRSKENEPFVQGLQIASGRKRNWMLDQYIEVKFNDGAIIRYTMPRYGQLVRDRTDVWIRAGAGIFTNNGIYLTGQPLLYYPKQLLIIRPRVDGDPKFDVNYSGRARVLKKLAVGSAVVGGAVLGAVLGAWLAPVVAPTMPGVGYGMLQGIMEVNAIGSAAATNAGAAFTYTATGLGAGGTAGLIGGQAIVGGMSDSAK